MYAKYESPGGTLKNEAAKNMRKMKPDTLAALKEVPSEKDRDAIAAMYLTSKYMVSLPAGPPVSTFSSCSTFSTYGRVRSMHVGEHSWQTYSRSGR